MSQKMRHTKSTLKILGIACTKAFTTTCKHYSHSSLPSKHHNHPANKQYVFDKGTWTLYNACFWSLVMYISLHTPLSDTYFTYTMLREHDILLPSGDFHYMNKIHLHLFKFNFIFKIACNCHNKIYNSEY
jgi:hypothetical protein